mmetsp:Transcript_3492/g.6205  ORF Transcript_3492/g.6205 Transcript_3492/m.6205 type:complete len:659 (-) Transcript_3492:145-2121(-)
MEAATAVMRQLLSDPIPQGNGPWPLTDAAYDVTNGVQVITTDSCLWIVVVAGLFAFFMAWGIGANDVANAFATSVGAGSISLMGACILAAIFEFSGAVLLGAQVTGTVRSGIINIKYFDPNNRSIGVFNGPEVLMIGNLAALVAASLWLLLATFWELPVSTTHSIVGALIGVGLAFRGVDSVQWISPGSGLDALAGVVGIICSWFISPLLSALLAFIVFLFVRTAVLRRKHPVKMAFVTLPVWYFLTVSIVIFFIIYKGSPALSLDDKFSVGEALGIAFGAGAGAAILCWFTAVPMQRRALEKWELAEIEKIKNPQAYQQSKLGSALSKIGVNVDMDLDAELTERHHTMHANSEKYDPKAEKVFSWMQVFTAAFDSFAHGANDVANAIAPFTAVYGLYSTDGVISAKTSSKASGDVTLVGGPLDGEVIADGSTIPDGKSYCGTSADVKYYGCKALFPYLEGAAPGASSGSFPLYNTSGDYQGEKTCYSSCNPGCYPKYSSVKQDVPVWILAMGGAGIVTGLAMWGYKIILAIGKRLTKVTAARGFSIELGAAITVLIASRLGLPVSTTHCQVGATIGVGSAEGKLNTVDWVQFLIIFAGWVGTLFFCGFLAAGVFAFATLSPYKFASPQYLAYCPGQQLFIFDSNSNSFKGFGCAGLS